MSARARILAVEMRDKEKRCRLVSALSNSFSRGSFSALQAVRATRETLGLIGEYVDDLDLIRRIESRGGKREERGGQIETLYVCIYV